MLPRAGALLDLCTSWNCFYPAVTHAAHAARALDVYGVGLNAAEMRRNVLFRDEGCWRVLDLNREGVLGEVVWPGMGDGGGADGGFAAVTCVVSIDYLVDPRGVCGKVLEAMGEGGRIHCAVSNRCFADKVIRRWMVLSETERLEMVGGKFICCSSSCCSSVYLLPLRTDLIFGFLLGTRLRGLFASSFCLYPRIAIVQRLC